MIKVTSPKIWRSDRRRARDLKFSWDAVRTVAYLCAGPTWLRRHRSIHGGTGSVPSDFLLCARPESLLPRPIGPQHQAVVGASTIQRTEERICLARWPR
jgi:hypothetical protein